MPIGRPNTAPRWRPTMPTRAKLEAGLVTNRKAQAGLEERVKVIGRDRGHARRAVQAHGRLAARSCCSRASTGCR